MGALPGAYRQRRADQGAVPEVGAALSFGAWPAMEHGQPPDTPIDGSLRSPA